MIKIILASLLACCLPTLGFAQSSQDFTFENDSGYTVYSLFVSPHSEDSWLNDVLQRDVLVNGDSTLVYWNEDQDYRYYDIRVVYRGNNGDRTNYDFTEGYDLLSISKIWVTWDGRKLWLHWR